MWNSVCSHAKTNKILLTIILGLLWVKLFLTCRGRREALPVLPLKFNERNGTLNWTSIRRSRNESAFTWPVADIDKLPRLYARYAHQSCETSHQLHEDPQFVTSPMDRILQNGEAGWEWQRTGQMISLAWNSNIEFEYCLYLRFGNKTQSLQRGLLPSKNFVGSIRIPIPQIG